MRQPTFIAAVAIALGLRLIIALSVGLLDFPHNTDAAAYQQLATNLANQRAYFVAYDWGTFKAGYPPLYPMLLAGLGPFLNPVIDLGIALTLASFGSTLGNTRAGRLAGTLYLFWPVAILLTPVPQKETLAILLVAQVGLAVARLHADRTLGETARLGITAGLLGLTQPAFVLFVPIAVLLLARDRRIIWQSAAIAATVMLPWWIRNWLVLGAFVPFTSSAGYNLLVSVTGYYSSMKPYLGIGELEGSRAAFHAAVDFSASHPLQVLIHRIGATVKALALEQHVLAVYRELPHLRNGVSVLTPVLQLYYLALVALAGASVAKASRELKLLLLAVILQFALFGVWFEFGERHRYLIMPLLFLTAAFGFCAWLEGREKRGQR